AAPDALKFGGRLWSFCPGAPNDVWRRRAVMVRLSMRGLRPRLQMPEAAAAPALGCLRLKPCNSPMRASACAHDAHIGMVNATSSEYPGCVLRWRLHDVREAGAMQGEQLFK